MSDRQRFKNKVVIVTGAAQGIGRGVALQVAAEGACGYGRSFRICRRRAC